jgi:putative ABC transport system substrate-binding protein
MSKFYRLAIFFLSLISFFNANASPKIDQESVFHVVMVSPRGKQRLEVAFMEEFKNLYQGRVKYTFLQPDANNKSEMLNLPEHVRAQKPDLIFTFGTPTTLAIAGTVANPVISDIPIAFSPVSYPIRSGIIGEKPTTRKNITGTSHIAPVQVHFEMMMKFKKFKSIGVAYNKTESQTKFMLDDLRVTAKKFNVTLHTEEIDLDVNGIPDPKSIPAKIKKLREKGSEWLYIGPDTFMGFTHRDVTTLSALEAGMLSFTIGEHPIRYSHAAFGVVARLEELGKFTAFKAFQLLVKNNLSFSGSDTMYKYDILINQCALDVLDVSPSKEMTHIADFLTTENGGCKKIVFQ